MTFVSAPHCQLFLTLTQKTFLIGTSVFDASTYLNWLSASWNAGTLTSRDDANCVRPNVIGFTTEDGKEHLVKVPEGKFDEVNEWVKTGSFSKLVELDSF